VRNFISRWSHLLTEDEGSLEVYITNLIKVYAFGNRDAESMEWEIFNNFSKFKNPKGFLEDIPEKSEATKDFIDLATPYILPEETLLLVKEYEELGESIENCNEEVAYWRKYHKLNEFILDTFGGDNCEEVPLTKDDMEEIRDFIKEDGKHSKQVDKILNEWDEDAIYVYEPWW